MITEKASINEQVMLADRDDDTQFLTFMMAGEEYGMDILAVQEIRGWEEVTAIPNAPKYVNGAINLRGTIVPIIDLRDSIRLTANRIWSSNCGYRCLRCNKRGNKNYGVSC